MELVLKSLEFKSYDETLKMAMLDCIAKVDDEEDLVPIYMVLSAKTIRPVAIIHRNQRRALILDDLLGVENLDDELASTLEFMNCGDRPHKIYYNSELLFNKVESVKRG